MLKNKFFSYLTVLGMSLFLSGNAFSASQTFDAVLSFPTLSLTDAAGTKVTRAVVSFQGQEYPVTITGLAVGGATGIDVSITGDAYGLNQLTDVEGSFQSELVEDDSAQASSHTLWLESDKGVRIYLQTDNPAVSLATGGDRIEVRGSPNP